MQLNAIAIGPGLAGGHFDLRQRFDVARTRQGFGQDGALGRELRRVARVLVVTPSAAREIRAWRGNPIGRFAQHLPHPASRDSGALRLALHLNQFARKDERHQHHFSLGARQTVAAVHQFFYLYLHCYDGFFPIQ